jgi:hypothetical protein
VAVASNSAVNSPTGAGSSGPGVITGPNVPAEAEQCPNDKPRLDCNFNPCDGVRCIDGLVSSSCKWHIRLSCQPSGSCCFTVAAAPCCDLAVSCCLCQLAGNDAASPHGCCSATCIACTMLPLLSCTADGAMSCICRHSMQVCKPTFCGTCGYTCEPPGEPMAPADACPYNACSR